jgi:hypothetical protein
LVVSSPGGGTDYAVDIFIKHFRKKIRVFFILETKMPMMYMDDAIAATIKIISTHEEIKIRSSKFGSYELYAYKIAAEIKETHS